MMNTTHGNDGKREQILEQIAYFEARLAEIGWSGDCAYEKSLARVYETTLGEQRRMLENLSA